MQELNGAFQIDVSWANVKASSVLIVKKLKTREDALKFYLACASGVVSAEK